MLGALASALNERKEEEATAAIEVFIDLAEVEAVFLRPHIAAVVNAMLQIAGAPGLDECKSFRESEEKKRRKEKKTDHDGSQTKIALRHLGVEFLVTLCESRPGMTKKIPDFVQRTIPVLLQMMVDLEDNSAWNKGEVKNKQTNYRQTKKNDIFNLFPLFLGGRYGRFELHDWRRSSR